MTKLPITPRRILFWIHLWIGLPLCMVLAVIGVTGSILVFAHEIEALMHPELHHASNGPAKPVAEIVAATRGAAPEGATPSFYSAPESPGDPAVVRFMPPGRTQPAPGGIQVMVDPAILEVLGSREGETFSRQVEMLHANLTIRDRSGRDIVGWLGVAMLVLGATGLVLHWPKPGRWKAAFQVTRRARGIRLMRELHGMVGIWGLVVFMIVSFSGVYLAFPQATSSVVGVVLPAKDLRAASNQFKATPIPQGKRIEVDQAVTLAQSQVPGALRAVFFPGRPDQPYRVMLSRPGANDGGPPATIFVDPWSAKVLGIQDPKDYSAGETMLAWQRPLHAGDGLGWPWRILVFLSGLMPVVFAITGIWMWVLKRRAGRLVRRSSLAATKAAE